MRCTANPCRSRGAVFSRPSYEQASPKNDTAPRPSSEPLGVDYPNGSRSGTAHERTNGRKIKRKQNADRRGSPCFTFRRSAHPAQGALACRRSTPVLPLGLTHPKVRHRTRFRGAGAKVAGVSRRRQPRLQRDTSHAGHSAGGHDVRYRPSATGTNPLRAGTASRSRQPESPSGVLARGARGRRFYSCRARSQAESLWDTIYLNSLVFRIGSAM